MRKVILQEFVTIDNFAASSDNGLDFMPSPNGDTDVDNALEQQQLEFMDTVDTILLGRETYLMFADYWPQATTETEIIADKLNAIPKIVFSKTLDEAPWGTWDMALVNNGDAAEEINILKEQPGKDMVIWGSLKLAQSLIKDDVIDSYELFVCPAVLGSGRRLFPEDRHIQNLKLLETKIFPSGVILLRYLVIHHLNTFR